MENESQDEKFLTIPFAGRIDVEEIEKKEQAKKPKKQKVEKLPVVEIETELTVAPEPEPEVWVKPESEYTPSDWAAVNNPPEPGVVDVATTPAPVRVVRRGFTTVQMAHAFLRSLKDPEDYFIVEVREGMMMDGPILCHYVIRKTEEL